MDWSNHLDSSLTHGRDASRLLGNHTLRIQLLLCRFLSCVQRIDPALVCSRQSEIRRHGQGPQYQKRRQLQPNKRRDFRVGSSKTYDPDGRTRHKGREPGPKPRSPMKIALALQFVSVEPHAIGLAQIRHRSPRTHSQLNRHIQGAHNRQD